MVQTLRPPESQSLRAGSASILHGVRVTQTGLIPKDMPIEGPTKQSELIFGFEPNICSRQDSFLVQPTATQDELLIREMVPSESENVPFLDLSRVK